MGYRPKSLQHMQVPRFKEELRSDWTAGGVVDQVRKSCCILCCSCWPALTVVLVFFLLVFLHRLRLPETLLEEVDQRLAQMLLCPVAVEEVSLVWVDL